jgi:hypothetical protein
VSLPALADLLREEGGLIGATVQDASPGESLGESVSDEYSLLLDAIHEGYLLHYAEPRIVRPAEPDLALLAGDRLYALGLARLAELGDLDAVRRLAGAISRCAQLHAEGRPEEAPAVWAETAAGVGR